MQERLSFSFHGIIAFILIISMLANEYTRQANASWDIAGSLTVYYALAVLWLSYTRDHSHNELINIYLFLLLLSCHFALLSMIVGMWFAFGHINLVILLITAVPGGLLIPFLLLLPEQQTRTKYYTRQSGSTALHTEINGQGLVCLALIGLMFFAGYYSLSWVVVWWYFIAAVAGYAFMIALLTNLSASFRLLSGCHLGFFLLLGGLVLNFRDTNIYGIYFLTSVVGGMTVPFLLLRKKSVVLNVFCLQNYLSDGYLKNRAYLSTLTKSILMATQKVKTQKVRLLRCNLLSIW